MVVDACRIKIVGPSPPPFAPRCAAWRLRIVVAITAVLVGLPVAQAAPPAAADTVVVCHPTWQHELASWLHLRRQQGHVLRVIPPAATVAETRKAIQVIHATFPIQHLVLIGDARTKPSGIPTDRVTSLAGIEWQPDFPSDFCYAELDDDGRPDIAVGRISVQDRTQLRKVLDRIVRYETSAPEGPWQKRVEVVGGVGGFGPLLDAAVEQAVKTLLVQGVPQGYQTGLTYANWKSPYCPSLSRFRHHVLRRYNDGCLLWVYAGHGFTQVLDSVDGTPILDEPSVHQLRSQKSTPVAVLLSCSAGNFGESPVCLAESMLRTDGGPVAVIASSGVSAPYGNVCLADAMLRSLFAGPVKTLGECWLASQSELLQSELSARQWIDQVATLFGMNVEAQQRERIEHVQLYHLSGDPLLRLRIPATGRIDVPESVDAGGAIPIQFESPLAGRGTVELVCSRGRLRMAAHQRTVEELRDPRLQDSWDEDYLAANSDTWYRGEKNFAAGKTDLSIPIPADVGGRCQVRIFVSGNGASVQAASPVYVRRMEPATELSK